MPVPLVSRLEHILQWHDVNDLAENVYPECKNVIDP